MTKIINTKMGVFFANFPKFRISFYFNNISDIKLNTVQAQIYANQLKLYPPSIETGLKQGILTFFIID